VNRLLMRISGPNVEKMTRGLRKVRLQGEPSSFICLFVIKYYEADKIKDEFGGTCRAHG
jgi:hypothetical protein